MLRLPVITETSEYRLPLCPSSAERLAAPFVAESRAARAGQLADLLADDPALLLWTVARAWHAHGLALRSTTSAACWLAEHGLAQLAPGLEVETAAADPAPSDLKQYGRLARASLEVAALAGELARPEAAEPARLLGCLHNGLQWLAAAGEEETGIQLILPPWLADELAEIAARNENDETAPASFVATAVARQASGAQPADEALASRLEKAQEDWSPESSGGELAGRLGELLARLARLETLESRFAEQLELEKLLAMKELAYGAGHEINNPLANIATRAQALLRDETDPERRRKLATINSQAFRAHEMIADMMLFAHPPKPEPAPTDLRSLVERVIAELEPRATEQGTLLVHRASEEKLIAEVDANQIALAVSALLCNSLEALGLGGQVEISTQPAEEDRAGGVEIAVADCGPGIPVEVRRHMFDPFYSGREAGRGLGFGLSKAWRIAHLHGGTVEVGQAKSGGARLVIRLPGGGIAKPAEPAA